MSTGLFIVKEVDSAKFEQNLVDLFSKYSPAETLLNAQMYDDPSILGLLKASGTNTFNFANWGIYDRKASKILKNHFGVSTLESFNIGEKSASELVAAVLLGYLKETQKDKISHIKRITPSIDGNHMELTRSTIFNLELFSTIREGDKHGSLIGVIDKTCTPMGARLLRHWVTRPLVTKECIEDRQSFVEVFVKKRRERAKMRELLSEISDIERILSKVSVGLGNARDLINLSDSLEHSLRIKKILSVEGSEENSSLNRVLLDDISVELSDIVTEIKNTLVDEPPIDVKQGRLIRKGFSKELDNLKASIHTSQTWISELEAVERKRTGISSLKVGYNKVFGYYIEISKSNLDSVPENYVRKQTLVNAERFITQKLKEEEELVLSAEEKINDLEYELFLKLVESVLEKIILIQTCAEAIANLDCLLNFSFIAQKYSYVKPEITTSGEITIVEGRHPVVEQLLSEKRFVPNDLVLNHKDHQLLIITGPNMAGKSVFIRQTGLIVLLAQIGCFVPAEQAKISIVDKIFVRSGASDFITSGLSTFMVEMVETAQILNSVTEKSLILLDEIGRGTTTYDGVSIAWAVADYLVNNQKPFAKTLFATHYHELQNLENESPIVKNYQVVAKEEKGKPIFLHKVISGGASHSYGVAVAKLAGIPEKVTNQALEVLASLESRSLDDQENTTEISAKGAKSTKELSKIVNKLKKFDVANSTPMEALNLLHELKDRLK